MLYIMCIFFFWRRTVAVHNVYFLFLAQDRCGIYIYIVDGGAF